MINKVFKTSYFRWPRTWGLIMVSLSMLGSWQRLEAAPSHNVVVLLAVDGLSENAFRKAQEQGLFKEFKQQSTHIAPFPTMTDLTWSTLTQTAEVFGSAGRIRSVEAAYFDETDDSVQGDPRDYYRRLAFPKYYLNAFESFFNPYVEGLMYFPTTEMAKLEITSVINSILKSKASLRTAYIGAIDSTAHTQMNRLFPVLKELDQGLQNLLKSFEQRQQSVEVILVSDHGNVGRFTEGSQEQELLGIDLKKALAAKDFRMVQQLRRPRDVAIPLLALGSWAPIYLKDRSLRPELLETLSHYPWFDLGVHLRKNTSAITVIQITGPKNTVAQIHFNKKQKHYYYISISGNPLQLPKSHVSRSAKRIPILESESLKLTLGTPYPDSLRRLRDSVSHRDFDFPDIILTLKDGYFVQNSLSSFTKMYRTHGSLSKASSYGILVSNKRALPSVIRTSEVLKILGLKARDLFGHTSMAHQRTGTEALQVVSERAERGIETRARDYSEKRLFQILSRFVGDSRSFFIVSELESFLRAFNLNPMESPSEKQLSPTNFQLSHLQPKSLLSPEDIGALTDVVLTHKESPLEALSKDPRIEKLKEKIGLNATDPATTPLAERWRKSDPAIISPLKDYTLPGKRGVMKAFQMPYLLERAITLPEKPFFPETRDLRFAHYWNLYRDSFNDGTFALDLERGTSTIAQSLFAEVFKETRIEDQIYPTPLDKLYNHQLQDLTVVYVPGIYNSLFDREIFSLGLSSIREDLGLRVITPPVESTCATDYNGSIVLNYLKNDRRRRIERGFPEPRYLILGYSKGAVDVLQAISQDPEFISKSVAALVTIASPLQGSSILDKTDLPFAIADLLSENQAPSVCRADKPSGPSISPAAMESFWRRHQRRLIGVTRYFSITFTSDPDHSHLLMKATKLIAQFDEDNDGVVTQSASRFPRALGAVDLGVVRADHLAGILSSRFEQKAFMRALMTTMAELDLENKKNNLWVNGKTILAKSEIIHGQKTYRLVAEGASLQLKGSLLTLKGLMHPTTAEATFKNSFELNRFLIPESKDPANNYSSTVKLPSNQLKYDPYRALDVQKLTEIFSMYKVTPSTPENMPLGINLDFHHDRMVHFRMDHQFSYESRSPGNLDDNDKYGYFPLLQNNQKLLRLRSQNNSIRMTTLAYRFKPSDFPQVRLKLTVNKGVNGADPVLGGNGRDDSAFQVWFTLRQGDLSSDRTLVEADNNEVILFGYYWGDPAPNGDQRVAGQIFENWYSKKNVIVAKLPESKQLLLNDASMLKKPIEYQRDLKEDLARAFPDRDVENMEVVAITFQHDSNDAKDHSEALFEHLRFLPPGTE